MSCLFSRIPNNRNEKIGRITEYERKQQLESETFVLEENISVRAMRLSRQQKRVVHELRRLNATIVDSAIMNAEDTFNLHHKVNARLSKAEKDFTCTLVVCENKMLLVNESHGMKRECTKGPKNYVDFEEDTDENVVSVVSPSLEWQELMEAAPAAPSLTVIDMDLVQPCSVRLRRLKDVDNFETSYPNHQQYFCDEDSSEGQPGDIEEELWDSTFSDSEVATSSHYSFEWPSEAVEEDTNQELKTNSELKINSELEQKADLTTKSEIDVSNQEVEEIKQYLDDLQLIFIPMPIEGFVCLCQWKYFLAAFETANIYIWAVQMETHDLMAVTTSNVTPSVCEAIGVVNIRYAINQDELPLLAVQLLNSGWCNDNSDNHVVGMQAMQGYWQIKPLEGYFCHIAMSQISPFLLVNVDEEEETLPTCSLEDLPEPEKLPQFADSSSEPEPESQAASLISLDAVFSFSSDRDQLFTETPREKNERKEELLPTEEILDSDDEEIMEIFEKLLARNVNMYNENPAVAVTSPLSLSQDVIAEELTKDDKPVITSIEYLTPQVQLTDYLLDTKDDKPLITSVEYLKPRVQLTDNLLDTKDDKPVITSVEYLTPQVQLTHYLLETKDDKPLITSVEYLRPQVQLTDYLPDTKDDKPEINSIEYLMPQVQLPAGLLDTSPSVHPPPAKVCRLSNIESQQKPLHSDNTTTNGEVSITKIDDNKMGTVPLLKYPTASIAKVVAVEKPKDEKKLYPNIPDQRLMNPGNDITMIKEAPEILTKQDQYVAVKVAGKVIRLDPTTPWCPIPPVPANASDNKELQSNTEVKILTNKQELQSNGSVKIISEKQKLQSNTEVNIVGDKQELQSNKRVNIVTNKQELQSNEKVKNGIKRTVSGKVKLPTPNTSKGQTIPAGYKGFLSKKLGPPNSAPISQTQQQSVDVPRKVLKIYPRPHMPVKSQSMQNQTKAMIAKPVPTTTIPASGKAQVTGVRLDQAAASSLASVPPNQKNVPLFGHIHANGLPSFPARIQASYFIISIPDVEAMLFKSLADANRFLNKHFSTIPEFVGLLPAEWKFSLCK